MERMLFILLVVVVGCTNFHNVGVLGGIAALNSAYDTFDAEVLCQTWSTAAQTQIY